MDELYANLEPVVYIHAHTYTYVYIHIPFYSFTHKFDKFIFSFIYFYIYLTCMGIVMRMCFLMVIVPRSEERNCDHGCSRDMALKKLPVLSRLGYPLGEHSY